MSINGIGSPYGTLIRPPQNDQASRVDGHRGTQVPASPPSQQPAQGVASGTQVRRADPALPAEPPAGTDPELWSILTTEERTFFAKAGAMGPLTYGRLMSMNQPTTPPAARGGRLDVKI